MIIEKTEPLPFVVIHLESVTDDALFAEIARRYEVPAHDLRNKLAVVIWELQLAAANRPNPLEPVVVAK